MTSRQHLPQPSRSYKIWCSHYLPMPSTSCSPLHMEALHSSINNSLLVAKLMPTSGPLYFMFPLPGKSPPFPCPCVIASCMSFTSQLKCHFLRKTFSGRTL